VAIVLGGTVVLIVVARLAATVGPAPRGLGIQPMEALRDE
jgi:ABC-type lipoprotein release transport system permease subunit